MYKEDKVALLYEVNYELERFKTKMEFIEGSDDLREFQEIMESLGINLDIDWDDDIYENEEHQKAIDTVVEIRRNLKKDIISFLLYFKEELCVADEYIDDDDLYYNSCGFDYDSLLNQLLKRNVCIDILEKCKKEFEELDEKEDDEFENEAKEVVIIDRFYECYNDCIDRICKH